MAHERLLQKIEQPGVPSGSGAAVRRIASQDANTMQPGWLHWREIAREALAQINAARAGGEEEG